MKMTNAEYLLRAKVVTEAKLSTMSTVEIEYAAEALRGRMSYAIKLASSKKARNKS